MSLMNGIAFTMNTASAVAICTKQERATPKQVSTIAHKFYYEKLEYISQVNNFTYDE